VGYPAEVALGLRGEDGVKALIELLEREPPVCEMLAQFCCGGLALGVSDTQTWLRCHLPLRALRSLIPKRYIATSAGATNKGATSNGRDQQRAQPARGWLRSAQFKK
jgi:hypothetical protein